MTREEASSILDDFDVNFAGHTTEEIAEAFDVAFNALEQEPCEDAVSREFLLGDLLLKAQGEKDVSIKWLEEYINNLPSVTPQEPRWIPVSERMPEEREWIGTKKFGTTISDEVYVTLETISGKRFCDHIRFQNGKFSLSKQAELDAISKGTKPIAWMKLPEPYQPKDGEK